MVIGQSDQGLPVKVVTDEKVLHNHIWIEFPKAE
jgi:hypothetical protein